MQCCADDSYLFVAVRMESSCLLFCGFVLFLFFILACRVSWLVTSFRRNEACGKRNGPLKTMIVIGSGGHTMEILRLLSGMSISFTLKVYVIADSDSRSEHKVLEFEKNLNEKHDGKSKYSIKRIPRSREVGQSYLTSVISTIISSFSSIYLVFQEMPDLILCNGPGTCVPVCFGGFLLKVLMVKDVKMVYVESICRVKTLSLSAKILYYFVDRLIVQWPELYKKYSRTVYLGRVV